ncbi:putative 4-carboxymuconolactone decarboxylase [Stipitochalara longipes BDJ]|nr:putative 4-carboxymuconolactone decarboxylase [Stipitochalara longipes BDJ]
MASATGDSTGPTAGHSSIEQSHQTNASQTSVPLSQNNMDTPLHQSLYAQGYEMRKKVVGEDYVAKALEKGSSDFMRPLQQFATESAWGTIWTRPGLSLRDRSLLNLVMLTALGKWIELGTHVRGAVRNGATEVEIREALLHASAYCGMPAGMEAFRVADRVLSEMQEKGEIVRG